MGKVLSILTILTSLIGTAYAQKLSAVKAPVPVKAAFLKTHPGTPVKWELEKKNYEAAFVYGGKETTMVYTPNGMLIETETAIKISDFPATVTAKLKGLKVTESAKIVKANGLVIYEAEVKGKDMLFDSNGNLLKQ